MKSLAIALIAFILGMLSFIWLSGQKVIGYNLINPGDTSCICYHQVDGLSNGIHDYSLTQLYIPCNACQLIEYYLTDSMAVMPDTSNYLKVSHSVRNYPTGMTKSLEVCVASVGYSFYVEWDSLGNLSVIGSYGLDKDSVPFTEHRNDHPFVLAVPSVHVKNGIWRYLNSNGYIDRIEQYSNGRLMSKF